MTTNKTIDPFSPEAVEALRPRWATGTEVDRDAPMSSDDSITYNFDTEMVEWACVYVPASGTMHPENGWIKKHEDLTLEDLRQIAADLSVVIAQIEAAEQ